MGGFLPRRHQRLVGKIRPASDRWSAVEWPGSKPVGWWTGLVAEERGGAHRKACLQQRGSVAGKGLWQARVGVTYRVRAVGEEVLSGAVLGVGSRWSKEGWSGLSAVARVSRRVTAAVVQTRGHRRQLVGRRGSGRWWGHNGGENECRWWPEMVAINEVPSVETAHGVGWLWGLFTAASSR
jgi:hypothetical protein